MPSSPLLTPIPLRQDGRDALQRLPIVVLVFSVVGVLDAVGLLIVVRRFAGALRDDLPRSMMLLTALAALSAMAGARLAWRRAFPLEPRAGNARLDQLVGWGSSLALLLLAVGSCYPANQTSDWLIWLPMLMADQFWRQSFFDAGQPGLDLEIQQNQATLHHDFQPTLAQQEDQEDVVQQLFRVRDSQGREGVYGTLRADFATGQRTAVVHVGFCPPLSHLPQVEAEPLAGPEARIKIVQALAHGVRLDVRLATPAAAACQVWIDMAALPASNLAEKAIA